MSDSTAAEPGPHYDVFIAHAGCDAEPAKALFAALEARGLKPFLDAEDLLPGDAWDSRLSTAQAQSAITAVLISRAALEPQGGREAHYWLEEIANGIEMARDAPERHRVVPVYCGGHLILKDKVPYGLRRLNSLLLTDVDVVAAEFADLIGRLRNRREDWIPAFGAGAGDLHDLLIDIVDDELRFIHLSGGRIAESSIRYDPQMLEALQETSRKQGQYDKRVASVAARNLLPSRVHDYLTTLDAADRVRFHLSDEAWSLPWELLLIAGLPLSLRCATSRQPRGTDSVWLRQGGGGRPAVLVFTSASAALPGVRREAEGVAKVWRKAGAAVRLAWDPDLLQLEEVLAERYDVIHFAGHTWFEQDNGESYFGLCRDFERGDGYHYSATRLAETLAASMPTIACLNSHFTAFVGPVFCPSTDQMPTAAADRNRIGFARRLLEAGMPSFVGTYGNPNDEQAGDFGIQFSEDLARGTTVVEAAFGGRQWARVAGEKVQGAGAPGPCKASHHQVWPDATVASYIVAGDAHARVMDECSPSGSGTLEVVEHDT